MSWVGKREKKSIYTCHFQSSWLELPYLIWLNNESWGKMFKLIIWFFATKLLANWLSFPLCRICSGGHDRNWTEENRITQGREQQPGNIFILALLVKPCSQRRQEREKTWRVGEEKGKSDREEGPGGHRGINQWIHIQSVHGRTGRAYQGMTEGQLDLPSSWLCPQSDISGHPLPFP